jgi:hypothetical protein
VVDYNRASHVFLVIAVLAGLLYMAGGFDDITGFSVVDEMFEPTGEAVYEYDDSDAEEYDPLFEDEEEEYLEDAEEEFYDY